MAKRPSISTISSGYASTTTLNSNFEALQEAFDNTISRDGSTPNTMSADLDMNGNDIINASSLVVGGVDYLAQSLAYKNAAEAAKVAAELAYDNFDDRYLGVKTSDPSTDNDGNALLDGALFFDTTLNVLKAYDQGNTVWKRTTPTTAEQANIDAVTAISSDVTTVAGINTNVTTVANLENNVNTVAGNTSNINTVAGNTANVTTVAGIDANVTTVAGIASDVTTVSNNNSNVTTVAANNANVTTVAGIDSNITTVAGISANVTSVANNETNINAVVSNSTNINTVATNNANVTTVAGISSDVTTVAADGTDIGVVAGISSDVSNVSGISGNVTTVAGISGNVTSVANNETNINTVVSNLSNVNSFANKYRISPSAPTTSLDSGDLWWNSAANELRAYNTTVGAWQATAPTAANQAAIDIVAGDIVYSEDLGSITTPVTTGQGNSITLVGDSINDVTTVAGSIANVNTTAGSIANVNSVAGNETNINSAVSNETNINSVVSNEANINLTAGSIANVNLVGGSVANVNTVAASIADVNRYAAQYTISASAPSSPDFGDLWYDSAANTLKYYTGSIFASISAGIASVAGDTSPQLSGTLDAQNNNITNVGTISGSNLQLDFGGL
mgnify:CR=1 FL=1